MNEKGTYLSLDEIFDTRIGLLGLINPDKAAEVLLDNSYYDRKSEMEIVEKFGLSRLQWDSRYKKRDNRVLANSYISRCLHFVHLYQSETKAIQQLDYSSPIFHVTVNTFPYQLEGDFLDALKEEIMEKIPLTNKLTFVHQDMKEVDMHQLDKDYKLVIMYDYGNWMKHHVHLLSGPGVPLMELVVPKLLHEDFYSKLDDPVMLKLVQEGQLDPFELVEGASSLFWRISYQEVDMFNIALPRSTNDSQIQTRR